MQHGGREFDEIIVSDAQTGEGGETLQFLGERIEGVVLQIQFE